MKKLEEDRDALLEGMAETMLGALNDLTGEERNKLYRMLRLEVTPSDEGYVVSRAFCASELTTWVSVVGISYLLWRTVRGSREDSD